MSGDEDYFDLPVQALSLTGKGAPKYIMLCEMPVKLSEARLKKKATNKGNDRVELKGLHIWTQKKYEDTLRGDTQVAVLNTSTSDFTVIDVDEREASVSLMDAHGDTKDDVDMSKEENGTWTSISAELIERFGKGEELVCTVFSAMGKDVVVGVKAEEAEG
ncbi:hypothetical protein SARC_03614 [Sphaeroforma arctica JP610]|uniref:Translation initiation factor 5A C-terminal domain-containing protein n=1 Tax=Sphaeroforma arctica JP610 TaxID=667725 RepID=A0A0L0G7G5_9EUKA|nr:hypothetical protein SARC_03614 [Sphaeroforma arctica JP610]KNC84158.1 hypothetical protein SARC_03614 [Sphaeroforma arctica JP610]|eukprot:XP_014158060.1 hypothetical protein SARC_03614 [Sphaeroforma arctica JP610]